MSLPATAGNLPPLPAAIAASVGVHEGSAGAEHDIIVLSANYGHLDYLMNWVCTTGNVLNLKYLIITQDEQLHAHLRDSTELPVLDGMPLGVSGPAEAVPFRSEGFIRISNMKLKAVVAVLEALLESSPPRSRPHVLFSDVDTVWRWDPFNYLRRTSIWRYSQTTAPAVMSSGLRGRSGRARGATMPRPTTGPSTCCGRRCAAPATTRRNVADALRALLAGGRAVYVPRNAR